MISVVAERAGQRQRPYHGDQVTVISVAAELRQRRAMRSTLITLD